MDDYREPHLLFYNLEFASKQEKKNGAMRIILLGKGTNFLAVFGTVNKVN